MKIWTADKPSKAMDSNASGGCSTINPTTRPSHNVPEKIARSAELGRSLTIQDAVRASRTTAIVTKASTLTHIMSAPVTPAAINTLTLDSVAKMRRHKPSKETNKNKMSP